MQCLTTYRVEHHHNEVSEDVKMPLLHLMFIISICSYALALARNRFISWCQIICYMHGHSQAFLDICWCSKRLVDVEQSSIENWIEYSCLLYWGSAVPWFLWTLFSFLSLPYDRAQNQYETPSRPCLHAWLHWTIRPCLWAWVLQQP